MTLATRYAITIGIAASVSLAQAQTVAEWALTGGGDFHNDASWRLDGQPAGTAGATPDTPSESARIAVPGSFAIGLTPGGSTTIGNLEVLDAADVTLSFTTGTSGAGTTSLAASGELIIDNAQLAIEPSNAATNTEIAISAASLTVRDGGVLMTDTNARLTASQTTLALGSATTPTRLNLWSSGPHALGNVSIGETSASQNNAGRREALLSLTNAAVVETANLSIGHGAAGLRGEATLFDATLRQLGTATLDIGADATTGNATLVVGNGGELDTGTGGTIVHATGTLLNSGGLVQFNGDLTLAGGVYRELGAATRMLTPDGDIRITDGGRLELAAVPLELSATQTLAIDYATSSAAEAPISFIGEADLSGSVAVSIADGSLPALGDSLPLIEATGFDAVTLLLTTPTLPSGLDWELVTTDNELRLAVIEAGVPGDFNRDNLVNVADYPAFRDGPSPATAADFAVWQAAVDLSTPTAALSAPRLAAAIPEPSALALLAAAVLALSAGRLDKLVGF